MNITNQHGREFECGKVLEMMDEELREEVEKKFPTAHLQKFYAIYCLLHSFKFNKEFEFDTENPKEK